MRESGADAESDNVSGLVFGSDPDNGADGEAGYESQDGRDMPPDREVSPAQSDADDEHVGTSVRGLAGLVADIEDLEQVLAQIATFAVAATPGADGAGVTLVSGSGVPPAVVAWSVTDPIVRQLDTIQYDICHEGPCLTAMQTERTQVSGSLGADTRWPRFGGRAARLQVHSALALALRVRGTVVGALNIYARERDAFTDYAIGLVEQFSGPAAVSVGNIQVLHAAHSRAVQLQTALTSRAVIDQAIGIVRSRSGVSEQEAFARLRRVSQSENVKLAVIAQQLVDEAVRRAHARHSESDTS